MYSKLGLETVFARPYNARAKVIERFFKELQEGFEKLLPSYIGSIIQNKPAYIMRNEKFHKETPKQKPTGCLSLDIVRQIEREILGME